MAQTKTDLNSRGANSKNTNPYLKIDFRSLIPFGLAVAISVLSLAKFTDMERKSKTVLSATGIGVVLFLPYFLIRKHSPRHALIHLGISVLSFLALLAVSIGMVKEGEPDWVFQTLFSWMVAALASLISLLIAVPTTIIPLYRKRRGNVAEEMRQLPIDKRIQQRISSIQETFQIFQSAVTKERAGFDNLLQQIQSEMQEQKRELGKLEHQLTDARQEMEHYQRIANLSKEDQQLFLELLKKNRRQDYWIGLVLGIVSSTLVAIMGSVISRLLM